MPDNKILEAMIENELNSLLEQSKDSTKFTPLEAKIVPLLVQRIKDSAYDLTRKMAYVKHYNTGVGNYIDVLEACESASKTAGYGNGYSAVLIDDYGLGGEYYFVEGKRKLQELASLDLIMETGKYLRKATVISVWKGSECKEEHEQYNVKMEKIYRITDYGKQLLKEHRKIKSEKGA